MSMIPETMRWEEAGMPMRSERRRLRVSPEIEGEEEKERHYVWISDPGHRPFHPICRPCSASAEGGRCDDNDSSFAFSLSLSCISSAESASMAEEERGSARLRWWRGDTRAEGFLAGCCARLGVERGLHVDDARRAFETRARGNRSERCGSMCSR
ncbi:hypothetical protein QJS10_CPA06g01294 [Acorus calamus]|uniref:Uncharacterized protein n=1 Tax=Acorus calamus TaxID=4465 RepID=A0AAV9EM98_ACOCL|nr:hypothetical protein QJS10_CPA06g01294 [Acorus calamus]